MRISGLATGMDTESIIRDMLRAQRIPLDKITQKKQYIEWQLDNYREINRNLRTFGDNVSDTVMRQATFMAKTVNISNENALSIKSTNATSEFSGSISIEQLATQANWQSGRLSEDTSLTVNSTMSEFGISGDSITISAPNSAGEMINKTVDFAAGDTLKSVLDKINKETGVSAFYDSHTGKIAMTAKSSGEGSIAVTGLTGSGMDGQNAKFTFNGLTTERTSNTFQINGFEITLKEASATPITFSSSPDTDKVFDSVKQFVDDYNKMIEELNAKIREPKHRDFPPLTAEQRADMKEKEIEMWEEKAMSGTLRSDPTIRNMLQKMRDALNGSVDGTNGTFRLSDIGITTGAYQEHGKLIIDETKLRQAIADDPNKVYEVLGKSTGTESENGLAVRFREVIGDSQKAISARAGSTDAVNSSFSLGRTLKEMDNQIERFEDRLKMVENRLWKQFTAMEMAIQKANAQSAQLMSAFGGGMM